MKTLFTNARILTMTPGGAWKVLENACLGVDGENIAYIGAERPSEPYDTVKDYAGKLLMPGLINTHCHSPMTLLRGVGSDLPLQQWLFDKVFPVEDRLREQDVEAGSELALLEMIATGTTSFTDMYNFTDATADAVIASGIKANLCRPVQSFVADEPYSENFRAKESIDLFRRRNGEGNGRLKIDMCVHAEYTCTEHVVRAYCEEIRGLDTGLHIHMSETRAEHENCVKKYGKTPAEWFNDCGAFDMPAFAAHSVWVTEKDMDVMKEKGVSVMHNPSSNMKLGSGFAPIERMREKGINVTLGTDGAASNNNLNMFEELHLASVIHNGYMNSAEVMKPDYTLRMATVNGALLQRRSDTGVLAVGKKADIIALNLDRPHLVPDMDTLALLCYSAQGSDVCMTMVDGRILYENGEYLTLDKEKVLRKARESCRYLYGR